MNKALFIPLFALAISSVSAQQTNRLGEAASQSVTRQINSDNPFASLVGATPFYTRVSTAYSHTSNAFSDFREVKDWMLDTNLAAGWRSTLGSSMYLDLSLLANRLDYANQDLLSRNMFGARASFAGLLPGRLPYYLSYTSQWFMDSSYDSTSLNFHTLSATVPVYKKTFANKSVVTVLTSFSWLKAEPSDFDQVIPGLTVRYSAPITDTDRLELSLAQNYAFYQHFQPGLFNEGDRQDWRTTLALQWVHNFTKNIYFTAGVSYTRNDSNLTGFDAATGRDGGLYDYKTWNFVPTVGMNFNF